MGSVVVTEDLCAIRALVMIVVPDLDDGKCSDDQGLFDLEQGTIPEAQPQEELAGATGCGRLVKKLQLFDHDLVARPDGGGQTVQATAQVGDHSGTGRAYLSSREKVLSRSSFISS